MQPSFQCCWALLCQSTSDRIIIYILYYDQDRPTPWSLVKLLIQNAKHTVIKHLGKVFDSTRAGFTVQTDECTGLLYMLCIQRQTSIKQIVTHACMLSDHSNNTHKYWNMLLIISSICWDFHIMWWAFEHIVPGEDVFVNQSWSHPRGWTLLCVQRPHCIMNIEQKQSQAWNHAGFFLHWNFSAGRQNKLLPRQRFIWSLNVIYEQCRWLLWLW